MKIDRGLLLSLGAALTTAACAGAGTGTTPAAVPQPTVALPAVTCAPGTLTGSPVLDSAALALATVEAVGDSLRPALYTRSLEQARRGIAADGQNAYGYYLAGQAAVNTGGFAEAVTFYNRAAELCPALGEYDINRQRRQGALVAVNRASAMLQARDTTGALAALNAGVALDSTMPQPMFTLGLVNFTRQNTGEAVRYWRRTVQLLESLPADSSAEVNSARADVHSNTLNALVLAGVQYLQRDSSAQAAVLLEDLMRRMPNSSDAAYHYALALYNLERWRELVPAGRRATELAPLSNGAWLLYYNGFAGQAQAASEARQTAQASDFSRQATAVRTQSEAIPVQLDRLNLDVTDAGTQIRGEAVGNGPTAPVQVEFTVYGVRGPVGTGTVTITPPARGQRTPFELTIANTSPISGYSYRVVR
ncbi:MAG TPA: hypothetical protein VF665_10140 [Longimicrobium sp.]|jgi:tetratricopeptide (TPR) repeat protein|uniref:tetratricopeptide repeat protein n=1 Tax=Longimicrobium sp. TaxID=2029185 RepID=UPI002EDA4234